MFVNVFTVGGRSAKVECAPDTTPAQFIVLCSNVLQFDPSTATVLLGRERITAQCGDYATVKDLFRGREDIRVVVVGKRSGAAIEDTPRKPTVRSPRMTPQRTPPVALPPGPLGAPHLPDGLISLCAGLQKFGKTTGYFNEAIEYLNSKAIILEIRAYISAADNPVTALDECMKQIALVHPPAIALFDALSVPLCCALNNTSLYLPMPHSPQRTPPGLYYTDMPYVPFGAPYHPTRGSAGARGTSGDDDRMLALMSVLVDMDPDPYSVSDSEPFPPSTPQLHDGFMLDTAHLPDNGEREKQLIKNRMVTVDRHLERKQYPFATQCLCEAVDEVCANYSSGTSPDSYLVDLFFTISRKLGRCMVGVSERDAECVAIDSEEAHQKMVGRLLESGTTYLKEAMALCEAAALIEAEPRAMDEDSPDGHRFECAREAVLDAIDRTAERDVVVVMYSAFSAEGGYVFVVQNGRVQHRSVTRFDVNVFTGIHRQLERFVDPNGAQDVKVWNEKLKQMYITLIEPIEELLPADGDATSIHFIPTFSNQPLMFPALMSPTTNSHVVQRWATSQSMSVTALNNRWAHEQEELTEVRTSIVADRTPSWATRLAKQLNITTSVNFVYESMLLHCTDETRLPQTVSCDCVVSETVMEGIARGSTTQNFKSAFLRIFGDSKRMRFTTDVIRLFYTTLASGRTVVESARSAQLALIVGGAPVWEWASFGVVGSGGALERLHARIEALYRTHQTPSPSQLLLGSQWEEEDEESASQTAGTPPLVVPHPPPHSPTGPPRPTPAGAITTPPRVSRRAAQLADYSYLASSGAMIVLDTMVERLATAQPEDSLRYLEALLEHEQESLEAQVAAHQARAKEEDAVASPAASSAAPVPPATAPPAGPAGAALRKKNV